MEDLTTLKKQVKKYLDNADEKTIKMIHAMLEVDAEEDWWDGISEKAKESIGRGLKDYEDGRIISHKEVMKKYKKWLS